MKVSFNWLKEFLALDMPVEKLAHALTMGGLEVEEVAKVAGEIRAAILDALTEAEFLPSKNGDPSPDLASLLGMVPGNRAYNLDAQGKSAEALLDAFAGGSTVSGTAAVQRLSRMPDHFQRTR